MREETIELASTASGASIGASRAPSSQPTSSPRSMRHPEPGNSTAAAQRSASGSLAMTRSAPVSRASSTARSMAPGSSGLGKATVGNSGSGCSCSGTIETCVKPEDAKPWDMVCPPTPCIGVSTIRRSARAASSSAVAGPPGAVSSAVTSAR